MEKIGTRKLLEQVVFRGFSDTLQKRVKRAKGTPNVLLREIAAIHQNTTLEDLDKEFRGDIASVADAMLAYITSNGFKLVPRDG